MKDTQNQVTEQQIAELVRRFYERAANDDGLQTIFAAAIHDWDAHHRIVENFWSKVLLNTDRYHGSPYPLHARLPLQLEHFDRWLALFRQTAGEVLPEQAAAQAIARAEHMAESFKVGMFFDYRPGGKAG
ncbi:MAG: group III truncated hemoglobin [Methylococcales bacterium]|nr:group III truncated hemoglobin [Methylococcales bacterium]